MKKEQIEPPNTNPHLLIPERGVLSMMEQKLERNVPPKTEWEVYHGSSGFFATGGHIVALGLPSHFPRNTEKDCLSELPTELHQLSRLEYLSLFQNQFRALPEIVISLKSLK